LNSAHKTQILEAG